MDTSGLNIYYVVTADEKGLTNIRARILRNFSALSKADIGALPWHEEPQRVGTLQWSHQVKGSRWVVYGKENTWKHVFNKSWSHQQCWEWSNICSEQILTNSKTLSYNQYCLGLCAIAGNDNERLIWWAEFGLVSGTEIPCFMSNTLEFSFNVTLVFFFSESMLLWGLSSQAEN